MSNSKISALTAATTPLAGTELVPLVQSGVTKQVTVANLAGGLNHNNLTNLTTGDVHTQYAFLAGRVGNQTLIGGTAASGTLTLQSTANATRGNILFGTSAYDEVNNYLGIGTTSPTAQIDVRGFIAVQRSTTLPGPSIVSYYNPNTTNNNGGAFTFFSDSTGTGGTAGQLFGSWRFVYDVHDNATRSSSARFIQYVSGAENTWLYAANNGNVGLNNFVGTPSKSIVFGNGANRSIGLEATVASSAGRNLTIGAGDTAAGGTNIAGGTLDLDAGAGTGTGASNITFSTGVSTGTATALQTITERMRITNQGRVGIGTTAPTNELSVNGSIFAYGAYDENTTTKGVYIGVTGSGGTSSRMLFCDGAVATNWQIDNAGGIFRWYVSGYNMMRLENVSNTAKVTLWNNNVAYTTFDTSGITFESAVTPVGGYKITTAALTALPGVDFTLKAGSTATTTNTAGGTLYLDAGQGTGTGASNLIFRTGASTGTGTALQTLTERMRITNSGSVLVGGTSSLGGTMSVYNGLYVGANTSSAEIQNYRASTDSGGAFLYLNKARGTIAAPTIVASGDDVGSVIFRGYDGAAYRNVAQIVAQVDTTPGAGDMPGRLMFYTTPDASVTPTERLRIDSSGNITIADGNDIIVGTTTGTKIGTGTTQKIGFYNATPVVRPTAYTQTYSTADKTMAARTAAALTDNTGGTVSTTLAAITAGATYSQTDMTNVKNALASLADQVNKSRNDSLDIAQVVNAVIDDLQALGLVG